MKSLQLSARMKLYIVFILLAYSFVIDAKSTKKTTKIHETVRDAKSIGPQQNRIETSAVVAIEIVDDDTDEDDESITKNTKRTIESSLGFGYQNSLGAASKPKYEIYKYSQHDIPPYRGSVKDYYSSLKNNNDHYQSNRYQIQKSITYDLGTRTHHVPPTTGHFTNNAQLTKTNNHQHQPGITLFTTLDQQGHVGQISEQFPSPQAYQSMSSHVPIIVLRVYTNQLANAENLYPNLPQTHPYVGLNSINLQSLLSNYMSATTANDNHSPQAYVQQPFNVQSYVNDDKDDEQSSGLQTHENYPDDAHTRVVFHKSKPVKTIENYYRPTTTADYQSQTARPQYAYVSPEVAPFNYYYIEPQQQQQQQHQEYYPQYVYQDAPQETNVAPTQVYNHHAHSVQQSNIELSTYEGKGPTYLPTPTRKVRQSKRSKHSLRKKSDTV